MEEPEPSVDLVVEPVVEPALIVEPEAMPAGRQEEPTDVGAGVYDPTKYYIGGAVVILVLIGLIAFGRKER